MRKLWLLLVGAAVLLAAAGWVVWGAYTPHEPMRMDESARVEACEMRLQGLLKLQSGEQQGSAAARADIVTTSAEIALLSNIATMCHTEIDGQDTLSEAAIRRLAFLNQQSVLPVLTWMVIVITLSGVGLAGLQLLASYKLALQGRAHFEQGSEVDITASKISTSSSVSGVTILLISLAFFYVFVKYIYLVYDTSLEGRPVAAPESIVQLQSGGVGAPPEPAVDHPKQQPSSGKAESKGGAYPPH